MAEHFGISTTAWAPLGGGVLTGKYTRDGADSADTKRAESNQSRLTEANLATAREVDAIADAVDRSSAQVAVNWARQRGASIIPIVGARKLSQIEDVLGCLDFELAPEQMDRLSQASAIELGFPHEFLSQPYIRQIVYGDTEDRMVLPAGARPR